MLLSEADRADEIRDIGRPDSDPELEAEIDDLRTVGRGVANTARNRGGVAVPLASSTRSGMIVAP